MENINLEHYNFIGDSSKEVALNKTLDFDVSITDNGWFSVKDGLPENNDEVICLFIGWDRFEFQKVLSYDVVAKEWSEDVFVQYWRKLESTEGLEFDFRND